MSRESFDDQLGEIRKIVIQMGDIVLEMVRLCCDAALHSNVELARQVIALDQKVDDLEAEGQRMVIVTTMRMAPVAHDLHFLISTLDILSQIEEAGDDAKKMANRFTKLTSQFPAELKASLQELGEDVRGVFGMALRLYLDFSDDLAEEIIAYDTEIDRQYKDARSDLFARIKEDPDSLRHMIRSISQFHSLEHIADHAVDIAKRLKNQHTRFA